MFHSPKAISTETVPGSAAAAATIEGVARRHDFKGVVEELNEGPDAEQVFLRLARLPHCLYLDSARRDPVLGRFSFVAADPFEFIEIGNSAAAIQADALTILQQRLGSLATPLIPGLPPFQGGAAGLFSYDLAPQLERLPRSRFDEFQVPVMAVGLYDVVVAFDHATDRAWIISQGFPEFDLSRRRHRANERAAQFRNWLSGPVTDSGKSTGRAESLTSLSLADLAPRFKTETAASGVGNLLTSNFATQDYLETVRRAIEYIHAGDIFQVNLAQRLLHPAIDDPVALYSRLRRRNPATFAGYFDLGSFRSPAPHPSGFCKLSTAMSRRGRSRAPAVARPGPRPICSPATTCARAKRTTPKT